MEKKSKLEEIANEQRNKMLIKNTFKSEGEKYSAQSSYVSSDAESSEKMRKENLRYNEYKKGQEYRKPKMGNE